MKPKILILIMLLIAGFQQKVDAQNVALKTNGLYWLATTPNLGIEAALSPKVTMELTGAYNPWTFKNNKKLRFWLIQPEAK